jgi:hypothetical protein
MARTGGAALGHQWDGVERRGRLDGLRDQDVGYGDVEFTLVRTTRDGQLLGGAMGSRPACCTREQGRCEGQDGYPGPDATPNYPSVHFGDGSLWLT